MTKGLLAGLTALFARLFPERQFYHRSHGEVHFVSLSGRTQLAYITLTLGFLTWVGYSSVNVVFKEQIISEKARDFVIMQQQYEQRLADLQLAYDLVNARVISERDSFRSEMRKWDAQLEKLESLTDIRVDFNAALEDHLQTHSQNHYAAADQVEGDDEVRENTVRMGLMELEPTTRMSRRTTAGGDDSIENITADLRKFIRDKTVGGGSPQALNELRSRMAEIETRRNGFMVSLEEKSQLRANRAEAIIQVTGLNLDAVRDQFSEVTTAEGGPFISLRGSEDGAGADGGDMEPTFRKQMFRLANQVEELSILETALVHIPLAVPVNDTIRYTSTYGARIDPFTRRRAFHSGMDMAGKSGAPIMATAPGTITYAGPKGPYGNLIEIDHGYGLKTRYGHLRKLKVKKGDQVAFYQQIATMGSTGRSTGPHLHYEVWFNKKVRDPSKFFEAGNYVFTE